MQNDQLTKVDEVAVTEEVQRRVVAPSYAVNENDEGVEFVIDLPGIERDEIDIEVEGRRLTLRTHAKPVEAPQGLTLVSQEFESADYERSFLFRVGLNAEQVTATFEHGVLRLAILRTQPERTKISVS